MRDSMLVNNTAYHDSSCIERGSSAIIINNVADGESLILPPLSTLTSVITSRPSYDLNVEEINTVIKNMVQDKSVNLNRKDFYVLKKEYDSYNLLKKDFDFIQTSVPSKIQYSINVLNKEEKVKDFPGITLNILDKISSINYEYDLYNIELDPVRSKTCTTTNTKTNGHLLLINENISKNDFITFNECKVNTIPRKEEEILIRSEQTLVVKVNKMADDEGWEHKPSIEIGVSNVSTSGPIDGGSNNGGDLKALYFTIQQMSFFEFKLKFENKTVEDVFNLPLGLFFDKDRQRIIGTPMQSGRFSFALIFDNKSTLNGIIEVPKLNREL